jgi:hypothetical protein
MTRPIHVYSEDVVLEVKFTNRFPNWFKEMVRCFNLMRLSAAKYSMGITMLGEHRFYEGARIRQWAGFQAAETAHDEFFPMNTPVLAPQTI